uniref:Putative secreted protein n=1 Tax=Anopheles marajoara TaxID=58244 RepID=A0A2M4C5Z4_9DIPT
MLSLSLVRSLVVVTSAIVASSLMLRSFGLSYRPHGLLRIRPNNRAAAAAHRGHTTGRPPQAANLGYSQRQRANVCCAFDTVATTTRGGVRRFFEGVCREADSLALSCMIAPHGGRTRSSRFLGWLVGQAAVAVCPTPQTRNTKNNLPGVCIIEQKPSTTGARGRGLLCGSGGSELYLPLARWTPGLTVSQSSVRSSGWVRVCWVCVRVCL